ncbi:FecR family protein [Longitalea luteola]|uniref:FecR family protein n=1 Tax=Longitalea luteola TaxID=2812563 RepID=UPI001A974C17|nr:FecR family protein [Longitalea luteola]
MNAISGNITQVAFGKSDDAPLTRDEQEICEEWTSGKASDYMKVDAEDPRMLEFAGLYDKLENKKEEVWESIEATHAITQAPFREIPIAQAPTARIGKRNRMLAAAIITGIAGVFALYHFINNDQKNVPAPNNVPVVNNTIEPGRERAVLTLADNRQIDLDNTPDGVIAVQDQMQISKKENNQIVYSTSGNQKTGTRALNNQLTTPYGGEYKVTLADGSTVWLNAGSSLNYPTAFTGNDRTVEINGEGFFEVAEDKTKPFRVLANGTEVQVTGTRFNVKAYDTDKLVTTTLVNGGVSVKRGNQLKRIKPNQQAITSGDSIRIRNKTKDEMSQALAWKNGKINLDGESVQSILDQIKRWYNVKIRIESGTPETTTLTGTIERNTPLETVLELLNTNISVQFTLQDHTVVAKEKK